MLLSKQSKWQLLHPKKVKQSVIGNMCRTAIGVSSGVQERSYSLALAKQIARSNGYTTSSCAPRSRAFVSSRNRLEEATDKIPFCTLFISDYISSAVRRCVYQAGLQDALRVVDIPPPSLKRQLVRNRAYDRSCLTPGCVVCPFGREGDCMVAGVIYIITCLSCGDTYIGETGRPLCCRIKEHLDGLNKSRTSTPLGSHRLR